MSDPILAAPGRFQRLYSLRNPARSRTGVPALPDTLRRLAQPDIGPTHDPYGPLFGLRNRPKPDHSAPLNSAISPFNGTAASVAQALGKAASTPLPARSQHNPSERETPGKPSIFPSGLRREGRGPCPRIAVLSFSVAATLPAPGPACAFTDPGGATG